MCGLWGHCGLLLTLRVPSEQRRLLRVSAILSVESVLWPDLMKHVLRNDSMRSVPLVCSRCYVSRCLCSVLTRLQLIGFFLGGFSSGGRVVCFRG